MSISYVVCGSRPWSRRAFDEILSEQPGIWVFVGDPNDLPTRLAAVAPKYVFFLHWSWMVPREIVERYECIGFHMTDLPYGRGGSPLQNLISRGHARTKLTAFRFDAGLDTGPVYLKEDLLLEGAAQEIYERASAVAARMALRIVNEKIEPTPQTGEVVVFKRRTPDQSAIPLNGTAQQLYDHIRMLDAEGYPRAFLDAGEWRVVLREAELRDGMVEAKARFARRGDGQ